MEDKHKNIIVSEIKNFSGKDFLKTKKIILNRPDKRNSLDDVMIRELTEAINDFSEDAETRSIVITGAGGNFCSGLYLDYLHKISEFDVLQNKKDSQNYKNLLLAIYNCRKPVIAMVDGYALAGGCGIASACDIIVASDKAQFGYTEVKIGFIPAIVMVFLLKRVSETHAKDLLLTSKFITGTEAHRIGFVNYVVEQYMLESYTEKLCESLNSLPASSISLTKEMFKNVSSMSFESALDYAVDMNTITRMSEDCKNGIRKFLTKK
jgi:methylglutaconyl-CoA hydratase